MRPVISSHLTRFQERERRQTWLWVILLTLSFVLASGALLRAGRVNAWSLTFARPALAEGLVSVQASEPPGGHRRGAVWLAQAALARGEVEEAELKTLLPLSNFSGGFGNRLLGYFYFQAENYSRAIDTWLRIGDEQSLLTAAETCLRDGNMDAAYSFFRTAYVLDPSANAGVFSDFLRWHYDDREAAVGVLQAALANYPLAPARKAWLQKLGDTLRELQRWRDAEATYQQLLDAGDIVPAYVGLGWIAYECDGDGSRAADLFANAISQAPYDGRGYYAMGVLLEKEGKHEQSLEWYKDALARDTSHRWWYIEEGNISRTLGNMDDALASYRKAIERFPGWPRPFYEMALVYQLLGDKAMARDAIDTALSLQSPPKANYYQRAAEIYQWVGLASESQTFLAKALELETKR